MLFVQRFFGELVRLYSIGRSWPVPLRRAWVKTLDAVLTSPLMPRRLLVSARDCYERLRRWMGERLVRRSPALYRFLGGSDPV